MTPEEILALGREHADLHGLLDRGWRVVEDDRAQTRAGECRYREREIGLTTSLLAQWPYEDVLDVILHEIAHVRAGPRAGHGRQWKQAAEVVGARPERCYEAERLPGPEKKWVGTCPAGHQVRRLRCPMDVMFCHREECTGYTGGDAVTNVVDWCHTETGKRPTGGAYARSFRLYWNAFRTAYAEGNLPPMHGAPYDPYHQMGEHEYDDEDHYFLLDWEAGRIEPLLPGRLHVLSQK